jgi:glutathione S-transferase
MSRAPLVLVSHVLCPYVQRAAIVLAEKGVPFERRMVDLAHKPDWFLQLSPLGKTPLLLVDGEAPIFESAVICDYLDEVHAPRMHPQAPLARARHRAWVEFASALLDGIAAFYNAPDEASLEVQRRALRQRFTQLEGELADGPFFGGARFSIVDAAFAPAFRYFETFDTLGDWGFFDGLPRLQAWRHALARRASVRGAVAPDYAARLLGYLARRGSALAQRAVRTSSPAAAGCAQGL